jgi:hypothetical protein
MVGIGLLAVSQAGEPDNDRSGQARHSDGGNDDRSLEASFAEFVAPDGSIRLPAKDYRAEWTHLGTFVVPAERDRGGGIHDVYAQPQAVSAFKRDGRFPDGAVIVKEVNAMESADLTTGHASWAGAPMEWFVMIKDEKGRYADNPLWGKGWGWALFEAGDTEVNVATNYKIDCLGCHLPAQSTDWIYLQGYPSIRGVNMDGSAAPE